MRKIFVPAKLKPLGPVLTGRLTGYEGKPASAEVEDFKAMAKSHNEAWIREQWKLHINSKTKIHDQPAWLLKMGLEYHYVVRGQRRVQGDASPKVLHRYELAKNLDARGLKKESDFLVGDYEGLDKGETTMNKKKLEDKRSGKERRAKRVTAGSVLIGLLAADKVHEDAKLIDMVKEATGSDKFDSRQLAWYKWQFRQGKLKGQDGTAQVINQGSNKKEPKAAKKKAIVVKKKKK